MKILEIGQQKMDLSLSSVEIEQIRFCDLLVSLVLGEAWLSKICDSVCICVLWWFISQREMPWTLMFELILKTKECTAF